MIGIEETYNGLLLRFICECAQFKTSFIYNCRVYDDNAIIFRTRRDEYSTTESEVVITKKHFDHLAIDTFEHAVLLYLTDNYEIKIINNSNSSGTHVRYFIN